MYDELFDFHESLENETSHRKHRIIIDSGEGKRTLFVNGHFLAEQSEFFDAAFFGNFVEGETKSISPEDVVDHEVLDYLSVLYGMEEVEPLNVESVVRLADMWNTPSLLNKCKAFLIGPYYPKLDKSEYNFEIALNNLVVVASSSLRDCVDNLVTFIGRHSPNLIHAYKLIDRIEDKRVIAAIFEIMGKYSSPGNGHDWTKYVSEPNPNRRRLCDDGACVAWADYKCDLCQIHFCVHHSEDKDLSCSARIHSVDRATLYGEDASSASE